MSIQVPKFRECLPCFCPSQQESIDLQFVNQKKNRSWLKEMIPLLNLKICEENLSISKILTIYEIIKDFSLPSDLKLSFLFAGVRGNATSVVRKMLASGIGVNSRDHLGRTPLHIAAEMDLSQIAEVILSFSPDLEAQIDEKQENGGFTPLHTAVEEENLEIAKILLNKGARIDVLDRNNQTPFYLSFKSSEHVFDLFISELSDFFVLDEKGNTLLHLAVLLSTERHIKLLLDKVPKLLEMKNQRGETALHLAVKQGEFSAAVLLVDGGSVVDATDCSGRTPLHWASYENSSYLVSFLIERNANKEAKDQDYFTPLHLSIFGCATRSFDVLISMGADIQAVDGLANTPLMMIRRLDTFFSFFHGENIEIQDLLEIDLEVNEFFQLPYLVCQFKRNRNINLIRSLLTNIFTKLKQMDADKEIATLREKWEVGLKPRVYSPMIEPGEEIIPIKDRERTIPFLKI